MRRLTITVYEPPLPNLSHWDKLSEQEKTITALGLTHNHFHKVRKADAIFVLNVGGYIGNSVTMKIGFATALNKKIFFMEEETNEYTRRILVDGFARTPTELVKRIRSVQTPDIIN